MSECAHRCAVFAITLSIRLLRAVLKGKEAATSAYCRQDEALASALVLKNGSKAMHLYQRFAVSWMVARERGRGRQLHVSDASAPVAPPPRTPVPRRTAAAPPVTQGAAAPPVAFDLRDGIGYSTQPQRLKLEFPVPQPAQCVVSAYADALQRLVPADFVNTRVIGGGCSVHRNPVWQPVSVQLPCSCARYYWNPLSGQVCAPDLQDEREADLSPYGGLLCDQMGIGKVRAPAFDGFLVSYAPAVKHAYTSAQVLFFSADAAVHRSDFEQLSSGTNSRTNRPSPFSSSRPADCVATTR